MSIQDDYQLDLKHVTPRVSEDQAAEMVNRLRLRLDQWALRYDDRPGREEALQRMLALIFSTDGGLQ